MEEFIHRENLALCLAEPPTDAEREVLLRFLAGEQAKDPPPTGGTLKRH